MSRIPSVPRDELPADLSVIGRDPFCSVLAHRPEVLRAWHALELALIASDSTLSNGLKERGRVSMAQLTGCRYCATLGESPHRHAPDDVRASLVESFATMIGEDHRQIDDGIISAMRQEFTDPELVELLAYLAFKLAGQVFGSVVELLPATERQRTGYATFVNGDGHG